MNKREYKQPHKNDRLEDWAQTGDREQPGGEGGGEGGNKGQGGRKTSMFTVHDLQGVHPSVRKAGCKCCSRTSTCHRGARREREGMCRCGHGHDLCRGGTAGRGCFILRPRQSHVLQN